MATLVSRISDLAEAVQAKLNLMTARLVPTEGTSGYLLAKASDGDNDVAWVAPNPPIKGCTFFCGGKPAAGENIGAWIAPYAFTIGYTNSIFKCLTVSTATAVLTIKKNGTQIAQITFTAGVEQNTSGNYSDLTVAAGDTITFHAPSPADATFADIFGSLQE